MACFSNSQGKSQLKPEFDIEGNIHYTDTLFAFLMCFQIPTILHKAI